MTTSARLPGIERAGDVVEAERRGRRRCVAMSRTSHGSPVVGSRVDTFCSSDANFISSSRSRLLFSFSPSLPRPTAMPAAPQVADAGRPRRQLHVRARAVRDRRCRSAPAARSRGRRATRSGRRPCARPRMPRLVEHLDRPATEPLQRLLDLPDRLRRVRVDAGVELLGQRRAASRKHSRRAVEEVLEPDPGAHPPVGRVAVGLEQRDGSTRASRSSRSLAVGDVGDERGPDADRLGRGRPSPP